MELQINQEEEVFDLESLIIDGTENLIPLSIQMPGNNKKAGVYIRPINTTEFTQAIRGQDSVFVEVLRIALYNKNKELFRPDAIAGLPAGVAIKLYKEIAGISGIPTDNEDVSEEVVNHLMGF